VTSPAARLGRLPPYPFALLSQRVREMNVQGLDVINLDIGSPDMPPPANVIEALAQSARNPANHGYAGYKGTADFRRAVAVYYQKRFGVTLDPEKHVLPLLGSKEGIVNLMLGYVDAGDVVLVPDVGYPSYSMGARLAGGEVYYLPIRAENDFLPDMNAVPTDILRRAKILWINYPNNPTGAAVDASFYNQMVAFCRQHDILLASDNPYVDVTYDGYIASSVLQANDALNYALEFMSFSKTYNMAGWRLGAAVGSAQAIKTLLQVKSNIDSGHFHAVYDAGIVALESTPQTWLDERNAVYQRRRDMIMNALPEIGLQATCPKGALYIWARVENGTGADYAESALTQARVSVAPGSIYGPGGEHYIRISLSIPDDRLLEALERLRDWHTRTSVNANSQQIVK